MAISLFSRLSTAHPSAVVDLEYQYRMNEDIMSFSNELVYLYKLKCGCESVAKVWEEGGRREEGRKEGGGRREGREGSTG
jgi:superfamily I DNA and/or RNA helicase